MSRGHRTLHNFDPTDTTVLPTRPQSATPDMPFSMRRHRVQAGSLASGRSLRLAGTPAVLVGRSLYVGALPTDILRPYFVQTGQLVITDGAPGRRRTHQALMLWRKPEGVCLVCFLNASLKVDFEAKPASIASASIVSERASPAVMRRCTSRTR